MPRSCWRRSAGVLHADVLDAARASPASSSPSLLSWSAASSFFAQFSGAPPGSTYVPAHIENGKFVPGRRGDWTATHLGDAAWLKDGALPRLLAVLDRDGEEARVVGGAVRNALMRPAGRRNRRGDDGACREEVMRRVERGRLQGGADRHRARHHHRRHRQPSVRGDDAARGRRDLRPQGQGRLRPRLDARTPSGAISPSMRCRRRATARSTTMSAGSTIIAARRVRFIGDPQQRIAEDYLRILRFFRFHAAYRRRRTGCGRIARLHRAAAPASKRCRASACAWNC